MYIKPSLYLKGAQKNYWKVGLNVLEKGRYVDIPNGTSATAVCDTVVNTAMIRCILDLPYLLKPERL
jgi:hypothetical protein